MASINDRNILYVVATPIGNRGDITFRALDVLKSVDIILSEHPSRTRILLKSYIEKVPKIVSFNQHNEEIIASRIIKKIKEGMSVALVSDAGTPLISDPGYVLVREAIKSGVEVVHIPGPSAVIGAIVISGLPPVPFVFEGFLPRRGGKRRKKLEQIREERRTVVIYESPHRLVKTLEDLKEICGPYRLCAVVKELTKAFERVYRGTIESVLNIIRKEEPMGEYVIVIGGNEN